MPVIESRAGTGNRVKFIELAINIAVGHALKCVIRSIWGMQAGNSVAEIEGPVRRVGNETGDSVSGNLVRN